MKKLFASKFFLPTTVCFLFFIAYALMGVIRQLHFLSGYDLAIVDQAMWNYSHFHAPITTNQTYAFTPILWDHVELIFPLLVPFYWIFNSVYTLIVLQAFAIASSGIAVWLIAKKYKLPNVISFALLISYLSFYGIQNAIWADVHSLVFGISFLAWFLYCIEIKQWKCAWIFFVLTIISKEDMGLLTLVLAAVLFYFRRDKQLLWYVGGSILYLFIVFYIYFPYFIPGGYRYQRDGLLTHIDPTTFYNTHDKRDVLLYSSLWYGLLPFLSPLYLIPAFFDLVKYFVVANHVVTSAQGLFGHYRSSLSLLLVWPTIVTIARFKFFQTKYVALYIIVCAVALQYYLHLPLSYFTKKWFWTMPTSVASMQEGLKALPKDASVVSQVNFLPHVSHRTNTFVLWPEKKNFDLTASPCGQISCNWFRWAGSPQYLLINTSTGWDIRYWLTTRENFVDGLSNLQKSKYIKPIKTWDTTTLYKVLVKKNI